MKKNDHERNVKKSERLRKKVEKLLLHSDIKIGGERPWDIQVHDDAVFERVMTQGSLALGETYMDGLWDCNQLDEFFYKIFIANLNTQVLTLVDLFHFLKMWVVNVQKPSRAFQIGEQHYDIGNDLYEAMLDKRMIYSCGYWKEASSLDEAQEAKMELICRKLGLEPGMRVLDIGCGWGGIAKFAAERYGVEVVGNTVSNEQASHAKDSCKNLPVDIRMQDYRDLKGSYDRILSVGMYEHVGYKNYRSYMKVVKRCLKPDGLFLLHTIGRNSPTKNGDPWMERYIFPNSMLPSPSQTSRAYEGLFVLEDWHNFSADYDKTLMQWVDNFRKHWDTLKNKYDERFYRMWIYYLMASAGSFRSRQNQVWEIVLSPKGVHGGYQSQR